LTVAGIVPGSTFPPRFAKNSFVATFCPEINYDDGNGRGNATARYFFLYPEVEAGNTDGLSAVTPVRPRLFGIAYRMHGRYEIGGKPAK
jgi:hypothetical protein